MNAINCTVIPMVGKSQDKLGKKCTNSGKCTPITFVSFDEGHQLIFCLENYLPFIVGERLGWGGARSSLT